MYNCKQKQDRKRKKLSICFFFCGVCIFIFRYTGTYNHMMVGLTQKDYPVTIEFAEILSMDGSTLFELPLTEVDPENKVYMAKAFIPPDEEFFYIAVSTLFNLTPIFKPD